MSNRFDFGYVLVLTERELGALRRLNAGEIIEIGDEALRRGVIERIVENAAPIPPTDLPQPHPPFSPPSADANITCT